MNRTHRKALIVLATGLVALAVGVPVVTGQALAGVVHTGPGTGPAQSESPKPEPSVPAEPVFPRPGGGPRVIHTLGGGEHVYLLDQVAGEYRKLPYFSISLSPNGRTVVVESAEARLGIADRAALLAGGDRAVRWIDLPPAHVNWSPDGTALLTTTLDKDTRTFTAHRYDIATGRLRHTPINLACDTCTAGWAADSKRYVVMLTNSDPAIESGPAQYLNPDGTPGPMVGADGLIWDAHSYSPSRRYAIVEPPRPFIEPNPTGWMLPKILDLRTGKVLRTIETGFPVLGWYDDRQVVKFALTGETEPALLEVVDVVTGEVTKKIPAPGLPRWTVIQIGSSDGLHGDAAELGF